MVTLRRLQVTECPDDTRSVSHPFPHRLYALAGGLHYLFINRPPTSLQPYSNRTTRCAKNGYHHTFWITQIFKNEICSKKLIPIFSTIHSYGIAGDAIHFSLHRRLAHSIKKLSRAFTKFGGSFQTIPGKRFIFKY